MGDNQSDDLVPGLHHFIQHMVLKYHSGNKDLLRLNEVHYWDQVMQAMKSYYGCNFSLEHERKMMSLVKSMYRYGYKASPAQRRALTHLMFGGNVILHSSSNSVPGKSVTGGVLEATSRDNDVILQSLVKTREVPFEWPIVNAQGTYVLGRMATCCVGVLWQLDLDDPVKCQCLILRVNSDDYCELAGDYLELTEDMRAFAFPKIVLVDESRLSVKLSDSAHVKILSLTYVYCMLERENDFDFCDVKMVVFDWACEVSTHKCAIKVKMIKRVCEYLNKLQRRFQIAIYSENPIPQPACWELLNLLDANSKFQNVDVDAPLMCSLLECETLYWRNTIKGIEKHLFVELKLEDLIHCTKKELKLRTISDIVKNTQLSKGNRVIIFIKRAVELCDLINMLEDARIDYVVARDGMTQKNRIELVERFFTVNLMITNDRCHRDMPLHYFDAHVHSIIHYDSIEEIDLDYVKRVRWFRKVDNVITLAHEMDIHILLHLQECLGIVFERKGSDKFGGKEFAEQNHYLLPALMNTTLRKELSCYVKVVELTALKRTHVVFFVSENSVGEMVSALEEIFEYIPELVVTSSISKLEIDKPCIFVTTDDAIKEEPSDPTLLNEFKKNVHVVISFEKPMKVEDYRRRCGWSKSICVVIHCGEENYDDFFELSDDVQVFRGVRLERYWPSSVCDYLTETYYPAGESE